MPSKMLHFDAKCNSHIDSAKMAQFRNSLCYKHLRQFEKYFFFGTEDALLYGIRKKESDSDACE